MFEFIKKLFKKEEEIIEKISRESVKQWVNDKFDETETKAKAKIDVWKGSMKQKLVEIKSAVDDLDNASLRNPNISIREKQFMDGNRKSYIQRTTHLLGQVEDMLEHEIGFFLMHYNEYLDNFAKSTQKSYRILQEFFANEAANVALKIKEMDKLVKDIHDDSVMKANRGLNKAKKQLESIENKLLKQKELSESIEELKKEVASLKSKEAEKSKQKEDLGNSEEFKQFDELVKNKANKEEEIKSLKNRLYADFSALERPLRKYQRVAFQHEKLVEHYATDALNALVTDFNLKIVEILEGMAKQIKEGKLSLKDKKTDKALSQISRLDQKYFTDFIRKYNELMKEKEDIVKKMAVNKVNDEIEKIDEFLFELKSKKKSILNRLKQVEEELSSIDIYGLYDKVKDEIGKHLKIKVEFEGDKNGSDEMG
jgi:IS1 family transposase